MPIVKIESVIEPRIKEGFLALLTEIAKACNVDIWVSPPSEEVEEGYGFAV